MLEKEVSNLMALLAHCPCFPFLGIIPWEEDEKEEMGCWKVRRIDQLDKHLSVVWNCYVNASKLAESQLDGWRYLTGYLAMTPFYSFDITLFYSSNIVVVLFWFWVVEISWCTRLLDNVECWMAIGLPWVLNLEFVDNVVIPETQADILFSTKHF